MIYWVFGGTAVGKKHFIKVQAIRHGARAGWLPDAPATEDFSQYYQTGEDIYVRWQWGREQTLEALLQQYPQPPRTLIYLSIPVSLQAHRATQREGYERWSEAALADEAEEIWKLAEALAQRYRLPLIILDSSTEAYLPIPQRFC